MGIWGSTEPPPPPPPRPASPKLLEKAWRDMIDWKDIPSNIKKLKKEIADYKPFQSKPRKDVNINFLNIMIMGPVSAGKSTFVNSIHSALLGKLHSDALCGSCESSLTKKFNRYPVALAEKKKPYRLKFSDMRGLEEKYNISKENLELFLLGHIADNTLFEQADAKVDKETKGYVKYPMFDDRTMCCIIVLDATQLDAIQKDVYKNIKSAQLVMNDLDITQIVVLTKIDNLCKFTKENITLALYSNEVKGCVEKASLMFGLPENHVFPVKNYVDKMNTNNEMDAILLFTLNEVIKKVESTLNKQYMKLDKDSDLRLWRTSIDWDDRLEITEEIKRYFEKYSPAKHHTDAGSEILHANLLLFGPIGVGKSSFVNSIQSVFRGEFAFVTKCGSAQKSETTMYKRHQLDLKETGKLPIRICDMPGLKEDCRITEENANLLLKGNIRENMIFVPNGKVTTFCEGRPDDRIACVIIVIDATAVNIMSRDIIANIHAFQNVMNELDVREVVLLTKVDQLFEFRDENVPEIFHKKEVKKCVDTVATLFNVRQNYVFPIKNYEEENQMNDALDVLLFQTMKDILRMAETTLDNLYQDSKQPVLCEEQWRSLYEESQLEAKSALKERIEAFRPFRNLNPSPCVNILLIGPEGAGKSSFINTVFSVIRKKIFEVASVRKMPQALKKYKCYQLSRSGAKNDTLPIKFCDMRGFGDDCKVKKENLKLLLNGHINSDTDFDTSSHITPDNPGYNPKPTQTDRMSTAVIIIDAFMVMKMPKTMTENIQSILDNIDIPPFVVLTKIDRVCRYTHQNTENAFKSPSIEKLVLKVAEIFGIKQNRVLPMKNYESEMQLKDDVDIVTLFTLNEILTGTEAYLTQLDTYGQASQGSDMVPWRETIDWDSKNDTITQLREEIDNYEPVLDRATCPISNLNILCLGPVGSGKSSFINTVLSVLQGKICKNAKRGKMEEGITRRLVRYRSQTEKIGLRWYDMPGLRENSLMQKENAELLLRGHIANNTEIDISSLFTPECSGFVTDPSQDDKIMGVVVVVSADMEMKRNVVQNINETLKVMERFCIPHVIVLTNVDKLCPLTNAFVNETVKVRVEEVAAMFNMTPDMVHPMKNYALETRVTDDVNLMTLYTLTQILDVIIGGLEIWQSALDE